MLAVFTQTFTQYVHETLVTRATDMRYLLQTVPAHDPLAVYFRTMAVTWENARATLVLLLNHTTDQEIYTNVLNWVTATQQLFYADRDALATYRLIGDRVTARTVALTLAIQHGIVIEIARMCSLVAVQEKNVLL